MGLQIVFQTQYLYILFCLRVKYLFSCFERIARPNFETVNIQDLFSHGDAKLIFPILGKESQKKLNLAKFKDQKNGEFIN